MALFYPQDRVVISAATGGNFAGSAKFRLYDTAANCNATTPSDTVGTGGLLFHETDTSPERCRRRSTRALQRQGQQSTITTTTKLTWRVTYTSTNANQTGSSGVCVENNGATITADGTVTFP